MRLYIDGHPSKSLIQMPVACQKQVTGRKLLEAQLKWASARSNSDLYYLDFKDLQALLSSNWQYFQNDFPSQNWIISKLEDLTHCRNLIAHNSQLGTQETALIKLHFNLITRQLGLHKLSPATVPQQEPAPGLLFIEGLTTTAAWPYREARKGVQFPLQYPGDLDTAPLTLKIFYLQIGLYFNVLFPGTGVSLLPEFKATARKDMPGERQLTATTVLQVGQFDIDGDGHGELFICARDYTPEKHSEGIDVKVFKCFPPLLRQHTGRACNWELIGDFTFTDILGEPRAYVAGNSITVPRNLRGAYYCFTYAEGEFRNTGNW